MDGANKVADVKVAARFVSGVLWEEYNYTPGLIELVPKHCHDSYQLCFSLDSGWRYFCRGETVPVSAETLSLINSEDAHSIEEKLMPQPTSFLVVYLESEILQKQAIELTGSALSALRFETILTQKKTIAAFQKFWQTHAVNSYELERDETKLEFLSFLLVAHSISPLTAKKTKRAKSSINKIRDYLADNLAENVSTKTLSDLSGLKPTYLIRAFRQTYGVSPHQFHLQRRIERAKTLLLKQIPLSQIAYDVGFFDQSHFGSHFRRLVGVSPLKYRR